MPHVHNGIGTWYSGKRNRITRKGACGSCGKWADLSSYDTTLFIVVLFIPIIPLKRVHVMDDCPICRRHRVIKQAEWDRIKSEGINKALEEVQANPGDRDAALKAIGTAVGLQDDDAFLGLSSIIEQSSATDPEVLAGLAEGYEYFGHHAPAEAALRKALELKPDDDNRRQLGIHLLMHGDPGEGAALLEHIFTNHDEKHAGALALAAEAYQAAGRHEEALAMLDRACAAFPALASDKGVIKARKLSTKLRSSNKPVKVAYIHAKDPKHHAERPWSGKIPWLVGPAIAIGLLAWYFGAAWWIGNHRLVYVASGVLKGYEAQIGGERVSLPPMGHRTIRVAEGDVPIRIVSPAPMAARVPPATVHIESSFWTRPFTNPVFVVNPDQIAIIEFERTEYLAPNSPHAGTYFSQIHAGSPMYSFEAIDYPFTPFPPSISMDKNSGAVTRTHVDIAGHGDVDDHLNDIAREQGLEAVVHVARRGVLAEPETRSYAETLDTLAPTKETADFLRPLLAERPVLVHVHRAYQDATMASTERDELVAEYNAALAKSPSDPLLKYLAARAMPEPAARANIWRSLLTDPAAGEIAGSALAYDLMGVGQFKGVLAAIEQIPGGADSLRLQGYRAAALDALDRPREALALPMCKRSLDDMGITGFRDLVYLTFRASGRKAAEDLVRTTLDQAPNADPAAVDQFRGYLNASIAYCAGDEAPLAALAKPSGSDPAPFEALLSARDLAAAAALPAGPSHWGDGGPQLAIAIAARLKGDRALMNDQLKKAAELCSHAGRDRRRVASWLSGKAAPHAGEAADLRLMPLEKSIALVAIGQMYPDVRDECFSLADTLSFDKRPPHLLLKRAMEAAPEAPSTDGR